MKSERNENREETNRREQSVTESSIIVGLVVKILVENRLNNETRFKM